MSLNESPPEAKIEEKTPKPPLPRPAGKSPHTKKSIRTNTLNDFLPPVSIFSHGEHFLKSMTEIRQQAVTMSRSGFKTDTRSRKVVNPAPDKKILVKQVPTPSYTPFTAGKGGRKNSGKP